MANFTAVILTAPPPGQMTEAGGALTRIDGRESVLRAADLFLNRENVKQVMVVFEPDEMEGAKKKFGSHFAFTGVKMVSGGPKWLDQVCAAAEKLGPDCTHVLLHDGARPAVPYTDIDAVIAETEKAPVAVALTTPLRATVLELDEGGGASAYHTPSRFLQLLTPQGFTRKAFEEVGKTKREVHASAVRVVKGSPLNVRVGGRGDEKIVKTMLGMLPRPAKDAGGPFQEAQW